MIFISYSHADRSYCDAFLRMSKPLTRYGGVKTWSDSDIQAGKNWKMEIERALDATSVALLLVSDSFLESHFIQTVELPYVLKAARDRGVEIMWVLVSDCLWKHSPLNDIQAAYDVSTPIDQLSASAQKTAWRKIAEKVHEAWKQYERPQLDAGLKGRLVNRLEPNIRLLGRPARRRTEIFVNPEGSTDWWHQCSIPVGKMHGRCTFGNERTKAGYGFRIVALTTDQSVGGMTKSLPAHRTRSAEVTVKRR